MVDEPENGLVAKRCVHWKHSIVIPELGNVYLHAGSNKGDMTGYTQYLGSTGEKLLHANALQNLNGLLGTPYGTEDDNHPGWTVNWTQVDEKQVIQSLYDRARRPVVEGLVNLVEAPEIPAAIKSFATWAPYKKSKWEGMRSFLKRASRDASNKYLAAVFGILPLITDANSIVNYLKKVRDGFERFKSSPVKRVSRVFNSSSQFSYGPSGTNETVYTYQGRASETPVTRYVLTYREKVRFQTELFQRVQYLINRFGSGGPASFAWELVPFSFVVDWFVDTTSVVNWLDSLLENDRIETLSLTRSRLYCLECDAFKSVSRTDDHTVIASYKLGSAINQMYERVPLVRTTYVDTARRFGKKQTAIALALLRQRLR